jgi:PAS domain S-box-containing protein
MVTYIVERGERGRTIYVSPQIKRLIGYTVEECLPDRELWRRILHPEDRDRILAEDGIHELTEDPFSEEYRVVARDGRVVWIRNEAVLLRGESGRASYWQGVMMDVTGRKQAEEDLRRAFELEREAGDRLRALDEMKNTFLHAVSHELRTPLSAVLGFALTLERADLELPEEESRAIAGRIAANARKLERLLTDLLDLDRMDRGIVEPQLHPTDLSELVRRAVRESDLPSRRTVEIDTEPVTVPLDAAKVERIVENLVANSVRHTPSGASVWIRVHSVPGGGLLTVEDDGPGVPSELQEHIFEPFMRGPGAPQHAPGVGVGLSLVGRFAELHGGRAWVQEREGGGASFRVFLPSVRPSND